MLYKTTTASGQISERGKLVLVKLGYLVWPGTVRVPQTPACTESTKNVDNRPSERQEESGHANSAASVANFWATRTFTVPSFSYRCSPQSGHAAGEKRSDNILTSSAAAAEAVQTSIKRSHKSGHILFV